ncbi:MAG TPA: TRAFs-binding domain-containing protein [Isosphaeraceae bacterium]|jgi:tetratricopeptide (TPR) repeat protein|nr:TRAFs-binding domain-containing protein [Isosphaeraceae bacterium]
MADGKRRCFVVMGFGTKTDLATGRKIDLDKSYSYLIKPVVERQGLVCVRADEITHSGTIDVPMYEELLTADLVIADISTANANAIYELGIRHALRPATTIVISENQLKYPFDLNHVLITSYSYLEGGGIDYGEVLRFQEVLGKMIKELLEKPKTDSPVYTFLKDLNPPALAVAVEAAAGKSGVAAAPRAAADPDDAARGATLAQLVELGEQAIKYSDFAAAKNFFASALAVSQSIQVKNEVAPREDPYLLQRLALATYKAKQPDGASALEAALKVLEPLRPNVSNDPETVGLAGAIEKRLFDLGRDEREKHLARAIRYYARGYYLRDDYYNGINLAYLLNVRSDTALDETDAERVADLVLANRTRREVLGLCDRELEAIEGRRQEAGRAAAGARPAIAELAEAQKKTDWEREFWCLATKAEAYFGLGQLPDYEKTRDSALAIDPKPAGWMVETFDAQIKRLKQLLEAHGHLLEPPWPAVPLADDREG